MDIPPIPGWLKLFRIACYVTSATAVIVHLTRFSDEARDRHHAALMKFRNGIEARALRLVSVLTGAAGLARKLLVGLYGESFGRRVVVSSLIAIGYFAIAISIVLLEDPGLSDARREKDRLERTVNPQLKYTEAQRNRAFEYVLVGRLEYAHLEPVHKDKEAETIRLEFSMFDETWHKTITNHPQAQVLTLLTLIYGNAQAPGLQWLPIVSLVLGNVLLDLLTLMAVLAVLSRAERSTSSARVMGWTILQVAATALIVFMAVLSSTYFLRGDLWVYSSILLGGVLGGLLILLFISYLFHTIIAAARHEPVDHEAKGTILFGIVTIYFIYPYFISAANRVKDMDLRLLVPNGTNLSPPLLRVPTSSDALSRFPAWHAQECVSVRPALDESRLDSAWPVCDSYLCDEYEQLSGVLGHLAEELPCTPGHPNLQRVLEAQLPWQYLGLVGRLSHQHTDQVVG